MIQRSQLTAAGLFTKTHGIKGELNATLSVDDALLTDRNMFICEMDGIPVPFFFTSLRPKGAEGALIHPEGINSDAEAKPFVGKTIYILKDDLLRYERENLPEDEDGAFADDLIGYTVEDAEAGELGEITAMEDSTANLLFILQTPEGKTIYLPAAEPFITGIDHDRRILHTSLPPEIISLND